MYENLRNDKIRENACAQTDKNAPPEIIWTHKAKRDKKNLESRHYSI